jgi:poly(3-hydroxybutyrate) depolymerase
VSGVTGAAQSSSTGSNTTQAGTSGATLSDSVANSSGLGGGTNTASTSGPGTTSLGIGGSTSEATSASTTTQGGGGGGTTTASASTDAGTTDGGNPTSGCGAATVPESGRFSIESGGQTREYILAIPDDYDANQPYRLIFTWHPRGGSAEQVANGFGGGYYGLESRANGSAIFVSPEGLDAGWANTGGGDIEFLRAMLDRFESELCIDQDRIFSTGFSYGGMMSLAVGCAMGGVFRAIAPVSGAIYSGCEDGTAPMAFWGAHGDDDSVVPLSNGEAGRDEFLQRNNCGTATTPVEPSPCVTYEGCDAGYPVTWCEFSGGHSIPDFAADAQWNFFAQF